MIDNRRYEEEQDTEHRPISLLLGKRALLSFMIEQSAMWIGNIINRYQVEFNREMLLYSSLMAGFIPRYNQEALKSLS